MRMHVVLTPGFPRVSGHVCTSACAQWSQRVAPGATPSPPQHFEPRACLIRRRKEGNEEAKLFFFFLEAFINEV